jgi:radical SAM superfamily enzyme YgiQ (UPF0313 family)
MAVTETGTVSFAQFATTTQCRVLLVVPRFTGQSFWIFRETCEVNGAKFPSAPLGLITVAAMLPPAWQCRLVNRNTEELTAADLAWADMIMTGGMLPQRQDALAVIALAQSHGKPAVVGGPDATSVPEAYAAADFRILGEAEGVIDAFIEQWNDGIRAGVFEAEKFKADVTQTPVPRFDLLKREHYAYLGVQFSRGCPFTCEFCDIIELYGRAPRTKTANQMLNEIETLYRSGYRGHLDFVDDNFIGNKKAVKAFLPHLIAWQKSRGYPFGFSTEASVNLADDDELLALMREANFFTVFVGIESPDTATLIAMQKKQNTRRQLAEGIHKINRAGMFVNAGFIVGFDSEKHSVAEEMIACINETSIPVCAVGLLYALAGTQLTRRLAAEGRLFPYAYTEQLFEKGAADQCVHGLNFETKRSRVEILSDYRTVLQSIYSPSAYYGRVRKMLRMLDRPELDCSGSIDPPSRSIKGIPLDDVAMLWRLTWRIAVKQPRAFPHFCRMFYECARHNPGALIFGGILAGLYLHFGPFARFVISEIDAQIEAIDSGAWSPLPRETHAKPATAAG